MKILLLIIISLLTISTNSFGQSVGEIDSLFKEVHQKGDFNGNVVVLKDNNVIYSKSFGFADFEDKTKLNEKAVFEFASVGKIFTAMAIGNLQQNEKIKFSDPVSKYIPDFPYKEITIKNLLQHTSGLPDYMSYFESNWDKNKRLFNQDVIEYLVKDKPRLKFKPGEKWDYSNTGYVILASIVEKISGLSFADFLERNLFEPFEMNNALVYRQKWNDSVKIENYAFGHITENDSNKIMPINKYLEPKTVYRYSMRPIDGDGNVIGTLDDLVKFDIALNQNKVIGEELKKEFIKPTVLNDGSKHNYGFAFYISEDGSEIWHTGSVPGYQSYFKKYLDKNITLIYVKNHATYNWAWLGKLDQIIKKDEE